MPSSAETISGLSPLANRELKVEFRKLSDLKERTNKPRKHSAKNIRKLIQSIKQFSFTNPILIDDDDRIVAGQGRYLAAQAMGYREVPTFRLSGMSEADLHAYVIADNRLAELSEWDRDVLAIEFQYLLELDTDFDVTNTGFDFPEIDLIIEGVAVEDQPLEPETVLAPDPEMPAVSQLGDLWNLGHHRLLCGDATSARDFKTLLNGSVAQMVFTDPPYNVRISGNVCGLGQTQHREFAMASGEMSETEFIEFLKSSMRLLADHSADGSVHYICMDWRHLVELEMAARGIYSQTLNHCVWVKSNGGMGSLYRSQHEFVVVYKNGKAKHINNVQLGRFGRNRTNVWNYPGVNVVGSARSEELALHPTVKPTELVADAMLDCSNRGDIVLDCFGGSGTTIMAAEKVGRSAYTMEFDPLYVDTAIRRWQSYTGDQAVHAVTGLPFDTIAAMQDCSAHILKEGNHV